MSGLGLDVVDESLGQREATSPAKAGNCLFFYHLLAQKRGRHRREPFRVRLALLAHCVKG